MRKVLVSVAAALATFLPLLLFHSPFPASAVEKAGSAGWKTCADCHDDVVKNFGKTTMGRLFLKHPRNASEGLACESCHGSGQGHADSQGESFEGLIRFKKGSSTPIQKLSEACLQCHEKKKFMFWQGSPHEMRDLTCTNCHNVHKGASEVSHPKLLAQPTVMQTCEGCHKQQVAQQMRFSHMPLREGKMTCTSCHNPHGTFNQKLIKANTTNDLCYSCHAEKRGPHLFEHPPVIEDCSNCHSSHGSNYPRMLKVPEFRSCRECHINFHALTFNGAGTGRRVAPQVAGRACTDCHFNIHGSNHPSGFFFTR